MHKKTSKFPKCFPKDLFYHQKGVILTQIFRSIRSRDYFAEQSRTSFQFARPPDGKASYAPDSYRHKTYDRHRLNAVIRDTMMVLRYKRIFNPLNVVEF